METNRTSCILAYYFYNISNILWNNTTEAVHHAEEVCHIIEYRKLLQEFRIFRLPLTHVHHIEAYLKVHSFNSLSKYHSTVKVLWIDGNTYHIYKPNNRCEKCIKIFWFRTLLIKHHIQFFFTCFTNMLEYTYRRVPKLTHIFLGGIISIT